MAKQLEETGVGNITVEEMCLGAARLLLKVAVQAEARTKSTLSSGATSSGNALKEAMLLYWHSRAMVELSQLLFWLERNAYARSLTMSVICGGYAPISMVMMKLTDLMGLTMDYAEQLDFVLEPDIEMDYGIEQARP